MDKVRKPDSESDQSQCVVKTIRNNAQETILSWPYRSLRARESFAGRIVFSVNERIGLCRTSFLNSDNAAGISPQLHQETKGDEELSNH